MLVGRWQKREPRRPLDSTTLVDLAECRSVRLGAVCAFHYKRGKDGNGRWVTVSRWQEKLSARGLWKEEVG